MTKITKNQYTQCDAARPCTCNPTANQGAPEPLGMPSVFDEPVDNAANNADDDNPGTNNPATANAADAAPSPLGLPSTL